MATKPAMSVKVRTHRNSKWLGQQVADAGCDPRSSFLEIETCQANLRALWRLYDENLLNAMQLKEGRVKIARRVEKLIERLQNAKTNP